MASLAGAFGGILAYGIAHMDGVGDYEGWRWIFILEGIFTVLVGALAYLLITNAPTTARWLNETEKSVIHSRLQADSDCTQNEGFTWGNVMAAFKDIKCWLYCFAFHTMSLPLYTLSLFLPTIITALGYTAATAQLLTVPPYAVACLLTVAIAIISARFKSRAPFLIGSSSLAIIGYIILLANRNPTARPGLSYAGAFLAAAGIYPSVALSLSYPAVNVSGQTKRAVANAMQISIGNLGAVLGTQLYRANDGPRYIVGHSFALAYLVGNCIVASAIWFVLTRENRQKEVVLAQEGKTESSKDLVWNGDQDARWKFET
ncbi:MAG: hypothetical protein M1831_007070 [Alyxoria varia]|nr:MAG: hypothetical protein M1831_007070 [Alyxoria varia]